jgi:hypothetical protein
VPSVNLTQITREDLILLNVNDQKITQVAEINDKLDKKVEKLDDRVRNMEAFYSEKKA